MDIRAVEKEITSISIAKPEESETNPTRLRQEVKETRANFHQSRQL
jgi:hypothetical protein